MGNFKRIFLITVDCLRADHVNCIGGGGLTPRIDKLAKNSAIFLKTFSNGPGTNQSFPSILSSTYFLMHGGMQFLQYYTTLAEVLVQNGYKTVAFHSNPFLSAKLGWNKGFQEFYDFMDRIKSPSAEVTRTSILVKAIKIIDKVFGRNQRFLSFLRGVYYKISRLETPYIEGRELNQHVMEWINKHYNERFFIWVHYMDPHRPYMPPYPYLYKFNTREEAFSFDVKIDIKIRNKTLEEEELRILRELYKGEVRYVDACIGELIDFLNERNLLEDALLIITSDHGEAFMEHSELTHSFKIVYNEVIHVPLIWYGLDEIAGHSYNNFIQLLDISPTLLSVLGIKRPKTFLGKDIISSIDLERDSDPIFSESAEPNLINLQYNTNKIVVSCILNRYKLIVNDILNTIELYNLNKDFKERNNIINQYNDIALELRKKINSHLLKEKILRLRYERRD